VGSIASVSGGSLTNGYVAQEVDYSTATADQVSAVAAALMQQIGRRGTLWAAWTTWAYLAVLLLNVAALVVVWLPWLPLDLDFRLVLFAVGVLAFTAIVPMRSWVCARSFGRTLYSRGRRRRTKLREIHSTVEHVICAADLHAGEHVYFSGGFVCAWRFGWGEPGDLALHDAVQASAAYPVGLPARWFKTSRHRFRNPGDERAADSAHMVLVDGGVYDNLGDEWAQEARRRNRDWGVGVHEPDVLIVVNASAPMDWNALRSLRTPTLGGFLTVKRDIDVLYDTTTSTRRRWLYDTFGPEGHLRGAIVQISQSPGRVAKRFADREEEDEFTQRAEDVLSRLSKADESWDEIVALNRSVKTTLRKVGPANAARLVRHGYVLAMCNLHVILGYPLGDVPPATRFEELAGGRQ
jgi:predicted acylesterase/phospholipase RssA